MLDKRLTKFGKVTLENGKIFVEGFDANDAMCREVGALALAWAIGEMQRELVEIIAQPGGTGKCVVD